MNGWKQYKLSELYSFGSGLSKSADEFGHGYPFLSFKVIFDNYFIPEVLTDLVNSTEKERATCSIKRGDVFFTRTSETAEELGMSSVALKDYPNATFNGFTKRLRPLNDIILPEFIGYYFRWNRFRANIVSMASETTRASLNNGMLSILPVKVPSFPEQRAIAAVLSSLDDKIDLLHRQNATLEAMAEALFRQWFVVEAKKEWEEKTIGDVVEIKGGSTPSTKNLNYWDGNISWTSPKDLTKEKSIFMFSTERTISVDGLAQISSGLLPKGTLLLSSRAPIGYLSITDIELAINQGYIAILNNSYISSYYMYLWCKYNMEGIKTAGNGSVFQEISKSVFRKLPFLLPPKDILYGFNKLIAPYFLKIRSNKMQIIMLEKLRDTLLPKLMSGEVRVTY